MAWLTAISLPNPVAGVRADSLAFMIQEVPRGIRPLAFCRRIGLIVPDLLGEADESLPNVLCIFCSVRSRRDPTSVGPRSTSGGR